MKTLDRFFMGFILIVLVCPAHAYIDPGSGSLLLQFLIAGVVGFFLKFRIYIANILVRLKQKFKR
jgi:hypothetical protein